MATSAPEDASSGYGSNETYIYEYSRGLGGVQVPRDVLFIRIVYSSAAILAFIVFSGRIAQLVHAYLRQISSFASTGLQQAYWREETSALWTNIKKHVLYSPIGRKRHNREIQLSRAIGVGTLPSRFQFVLVVLYFSSQVFYCCYLDYAVNTPAALLAELRGRSGVLAVLNMVPLFLLATRNNPLISILHISFDTYNLLHRWLGRIVMVESVVHTVAWAINAVNEKDMDDMLFRVRSTPFFTWGLVATVSMIFLCIHSLSPIRHAFYETFLHLHQLAALLAFLGVWYHLQLDSLSQRSWGSVIAIIWLLERTTRLVRLAYLNMSTKHGSTQMTVQALPGEACRVTFHLPRNVKIQPGCHVFAYIPCVSWWMSHPFSIAWAEAVSPTPDSPRYHDVKSVSSTPSTSDLEKQSHDLDQYFEPSHRPTEVSLIVGAREGMTRKLYNLARSKPNGILRAPGYIEGPYGSHPVNFSSYGTAVLFSAGAGITHHLLFTRDLIERAATSRGATRRVYLIWSVRSTEHLSWISKWMDQILRLPGRREILIVKVFVSKPKRAADIVSPSATVQMHSGRCRPDVILEELMPKSVGATIVSVCGPGAFADEVRSAARANIGKGAVVDFAEEAFTW
ncbi:Uncharacterized protein PECH_004010 [Penicillium ucsense]|uniref:FAD-binding FR-type domain-containing protein n=1 Tax=Penicillium ucsense TaxID=2839758 RepID=A0A8J8W356_9EURO|nr:Uncharacterized protein PECM_004691 [Penicillium ucsense]KAF7737314.1 Uncharacterized protein PECH_004010 [Penicillium ucsense]